MTARLQVVLSAIACLLLVGIPTPVVGQGSSSQPGWQCQIPGAGAFFGQGEKECVPVPGDCNAINANLNGTVVVLDVNSLQYNGGPNHPPAVTTAKQCCDKCKSDPRCNAWSFCWKEGGCGPYCDPAATGDGKAPDQRDLTREFGQFGGCADGNKWPRFMCTLKRIPDPSPGGPRVYLPSGEDWASGVVNKAAGPGNSSGGSNGSGSGGDATAGLGSCKTVSNSNYQGDTVVFDVNRPAEITPPPAEAATRLCTAARRAAVAAGAATPRQLAPARTEPSGAPLAAVRRYPLYFCGLKKSADPSKPAAYPGDQGGFDSGTLS
ncbi:hypothetical protein N2152v2_009678 [Parachlorella kessleri]